MAQSWFGVAIVTVFVLMTGLCGVSLAVHGARGSGRLALAEANNVVMGVAMILMVVPATAGSVAPELGVVVFGVAAAGWLGLLLTTRLLGDAFGSVVGRDRCTGHPLHLLLVDAAMVVMYVAMVPASPSSAAGTEPMPGMDHGAMDHGGMDHGAMAGASHSGTTVLQVVTVLLAVYLIGHAVATVVVLARSTSSASGNGDAGGGDTDDGGTGGGVALLTRPVGVIAHGRTQLVGQAGMGLAMAAMLLVGT